MEDLELDLFLEQRARFQSWADIPPVLTADIERELDQRERVSWRKRPIPVESRLVEFHVAGGDELWGGVAAWGNLIVKLHGYRFPIEEVELPRIEDATPYLEGQKRMEAR